MRVYLAGAIDFIDRRDAGEWRHEAAYMLQGHGIEAVCPLRDGWTSTTGSWTLGGRSIADSNMIVKRDIELIDSCDGLLVNLNDNSVGTFMEIFHAWNTGKFVIAYVLGRDLHKSAFLKVTLTERHEFLSEAVENIVRRHKNAVYLAEYRREKETLETTP